MRSNAFLLPLLACLGFVIGIFIYSFDSDRLISAPYSPHYSGFLQAGDSYIQHDAFRNSSLTAEESSSSVWFFRKYPGFLIWSLMHVVGVSLCLILALGVLRQLMNLKKIVSFFSAKLLKAFIVVLAVLAPLIFLVYKFAYSFDYVAFLMPLKNAGAKIYTFEALNYLTGAISLVAMTVVSLSLNSSEKNSVTSEQNAKLQKCFITSLYIAAFVIGYATLAGGQLYKSLNHFYSDISGNESGSLYFPNEIIYALGIFNSFILAVFFLPIIRVRINHPQASKEGKETGLGKLKSFLHLKEGTWEDAKTVFAILAPIFAAIFSV